MNKMHALLAAGLVATQVASAAVLTFDAQPEQYFVTPIFEAGFTLHSIADGFGTNNHSLWPSNGTVHLMSWTNNSALSGFRMTADDSSVFSISSFLFGSGYVRGTEGVTSLVVSGTGGSGPFSQTFTSGVDYFDYGPGLTLLTMASGNTAMQYTFEAFGNRNRAQFDNIVVNAAVIPEPFSLALVMLGLAGVGLSRRQRAV